GPVAEPIPRPQDKRATARPPHARLGGSRIVRYRSSRAARPVRPARKRGLPSHPYPINRRLKASYNQGSVAGACRAIKKCMTQPLIKATPVKKTIPTAIAPHDSAAGQGYVSAPPATSSSRLPRQHSTNPAAIAMWIGPHQGVFASTDGRSSKPPAGTG